MELRDLNEFVQKADKKQLEALAYFGSWLAEMSTKHCSCTNQCSRTCPIVKTMFADFKNAQSKLQS